MRATLAGIEVEGTPSEMGEFLKQIRGIETRRRRRRSRGIEKGSGGRSLARPFVCASCGKTYQSKDSRRHHERKKHGIQRLKRGKDLTTGEKEKVVLSRLYSLPANKSPHLAERGRTLLILSRETGFPIAQIRIILTALVQKKLARQVENPFDPKSQFFFKEPDAPSVEIVEEEPMIP